MVVSVAAETVRHLTNTFNVPHKKPAFGTKAVAEVEVCSDI